MRFIVSGGNLWKKCAINSPGLSAHICCSESAVQSNHSSNQPKDRPNRSIDSLINQSNPSVALTFSEPIVTAKQLTLRTTIPNRPTNRNFSLNGLAGKIIKGKFPSVSTQYSKNLRALVNDMLATNPKKRPDIEQILRKSFVQTRVKEFVGDLDADELHRQVET